MMDRNSTSKDFDEQIRKQLDVVTTLLASGKRNQESTHQALEALDRMRSRVLSELSSMTSNVTKQIADASETTANEAARLLQIKFVEADAQAVAASARYKSAGRWLSAKVFAFITLVLAIAGITLWFIIKPMLPTAAEMQQRRDEIVAMESEVAALRKKGASLQWNICNTGKNGEVQKNCFRIDGHIYMSPNDDKAYGVPYGKK